MVPALLLPTLMLTWQAHSYVPAGYLGKVLPPRDSVVDVYLELIDNGKIIPLDQSTVQWSVNNKFLIGGTNLKHASFMLDRFTTRTYAVTATIKDYNGQNINKTVQINRTDPLVVLKAPISQTDAAGTHVEFTAKPFFFSSLNPNDLIFAWLVNGVQGASQTGDLSVLLPAGNAERTLAVEVTASNNNNGVESASAQGEFIVGK